jgi:ribosomal protein L11 methyltransferase
VHWRTIRVHAPDDESRQAMVAALFASGAGGVHEHETTLITHVPVEADLTAVHAEAAARAGVTVELEELGAVDWSSAWPTQVGIQRLGPISLAPPWLAGDVADGSLVVTIEPGMAFGTGEHETTRSVVRLLPSVLRQGDSVADLGAGSAVLAICAAKLGAQRVFAIESDLDAIPNAEENVERNGVADRVVVLHGDAQALLPAVSPVRVILANIISGVLLELAPSMRRALAPDGVVVMSGVLRTEREALLATLGHSGWRLVAERVEGDWWSGIVAPA